MVSEKHPIVGPSTQSYAQEDWAEVCDTPEMTDEQIATARPLAEAMPELVEAIYKRRGPQKAPVKQQIALRVDRDVLEAFRATGPGWQGRMNEALREWLARRAA